MKVNARDFRDALLIAKKTKPNHYTLRAQAGALIVGGYGACVEVDVYAEGAARWAYTVDTDIQKVVTKTYKTTEHYYVMAHVSGQIDLRTDAGTIFSFHGGHELGEDDALPKPGPNARNVSADDVRRMLDTVRPAMCRDDARSNLVGIYVDDGARAVATDGHRLATCPVDLDGVDGILPADAMDLLDYAISKTKADKVRYAYDQDGVTFIVAHITKGVPVEIRADYVEGTFPDYNTVLPDEYGAEFVADASEIIDACKALGVVAPKDDKIVLDASDEGVSLAVDGKARHPLADAKIDTASVKLGLNHKYLIDAVTSLDCERVRVGMTDTLSPMRITDADGDGETFVIVMPMRI